MKHLKVFKTKAAYNQYKQAGDIEYPLTSYIEETDETIFDHWIPDSSTIMHIDDYCAYYDDCESDAKPTPLQIYQCVYQNYLNNNRYDRCHFITEMIYKGHYYWLWEEEDNEDSGNPSSYLLTPFYCNFNDFYKRSIHHDSSLKYSPIVKELNRDLEIDRYLDDINSRNHLGFNDFDYSEKVLITVTSQSHPMTAPETAGGDTEDFEGVLIGTQNSSEGVPKGDPFWTESYDTLYEFVGKMSYNNREYFLWQYYNGDEGCDSSRCYKDYILTQTFSSPEELYLNSCMANENNEFHVVIYYITDDNIVYSASNHEDILSVVYLP